MSCDFALHVPQIHGYFLRDMCLERLAKGVWSQLNIGRHLIVPFLRMIIGLLVHEHCCYETWIFFFCSESQMSKCIFNLKKNTQPCRFWMKHIIHYVYTRSFAKIDYGFHILRWKSAVSAFSLITTESLEWYSKTSYLIFYQIWTLISAKKDSNIISLPKTETLPIGDIVISDWTTSTV